METKIVEKEINLVEKKNKIVENKILLKFRHERGEVWLKP